MKVNWIKEKWILQKYSDGKMSVGPRFDFGFQPVCDITLRKPEETEAYAKLIAAAPDLLAACEFALEEGTSIKATDKLEAAIAATE